MTVSAGASHGFVALRLLVALAVASFLVVKTHAVSSAAHVQGPPVFQLRSTCGANNVRAFSDGHGKFRFSISFLSQIDCGLVKHTGAFTLTTGAQMSGLGSWNPFPGRSGVTESSGVFQGILFTDSLLMSTNWMKSGLTRKSKPFSESPELSQGVPLLVTAEPASLGLMGLGLVAIGMLVRRKLRAGELSANGPSS